MYGANWRVFVEAVVGRPVRAERRVRRDVHEPRRADAAGAVEHELRTADVDVEQLADAAARGGSPPPRARRSAWPMPSNRRSTTVGSRTSPAIDLDPRVDDLEQRRVGAAGYEAPDAPAGRL